MTDSPDILLVDDHVGFRKVVAQTLALAARDYREAGSGADAIAQCNECCPRVVLMDYEMPGLDGLEATREILRGHPETIVVLLTQHDDPQLERAAIQAGARAFLSKMNLERLPALLLFLRTS